MFSRTLNAKTGRRAILSSPISKLPVELLAEIFRLNIPHDSNAVWDVIQVSKESLFQRSLGWVVVTWVCRRWREVALNDPTLWTIIPVNYPLWSLAMLERSKALGIVVNIDVQQFSRISRWQLILHAPRVADLTLHLEGPDVALALLAPFTSTPRLSKLNLKSSGRPQRHVRLPNVFFRDITSLRNLELTGIDVDWDSHLLYNPLRELSIREISPEGKPTMTQFRGMLQRISPTLEILRLTHTSPHMTDATENGPVFFPLIEHVEVSDGPNELAVLFNTIAFGDRLESIRIFTTFHLLATPTILASLKAMHHQSASVRQFCTVASHLSVGIQGFHAFTQGAGAQEEGTARQGTVKSIHLDHEHLPDMVMDAASAGMFPSFVETIFHILHWTNLRFLVLHLDWYDQQPMSELPDVLRRTFGALTGVEHLTLSGAMTTTYGVEALSPDSTSLPKYMPFTALVSICIMSCHIDSSMWNGITDMARMRVLFAFPITKIEFNYCAGFDSKYISDVKRFVSKVVWHKHDENFWNSRNNHHNTRPTYFYGLAGDDEKDESNDGNEWA